MALICLLQKQSVIARTEKRLLLFGRDDRELVEGNDFTAHQQSEEKTQQRDNPKFVRRGPACRDEEKPFF